MPNYSALHYAAKAEKANLLAQEAAEKAKEVRDSLEDIDISQCLRKTGDEVFQDGTLTVKGDNHPLVIEGMAGTSATGLQVKDSLGAGETDLEHYATGDRYGSRLVNRTATGNEGVLDLYTTTAGVSILDATDVSSVLVPTAALGDATNRAASTEFVTNAMLDKADADGSNFTAEAKETIVGWGMPDNDASVTVPKTTSTPFTCPKNGYLYLAAYGNTAQAYIIFKSSLVTYRENCYCCTVPASGDAVQANIFPVRKGEVLTYVKAAGSVTTAVYIPCIGG